MHDELFAAHQRGIDTMMGTGRAWIHGTARMRGEFPADTPHDDVVGVIDRASSVGYFPNGRAAYKNVTMGPLRSVPVQGRECYYVDVYDDANWFLVSLPEPGVLAASQSFTISGSADSPQGFLLPDVEALLTDLLTLAYIRAMDLGFTGWIDACVDLVDATDDRSARMWVLDERSGDVRVARVEETMPTAYASLDTRATFEEDMHVVVEATADIARHFGVRRSQWVESPDTEAAQAELHGIEDSYAEFMQSKADAR